MGIYVTCRCGQSFQARAELSGRTLACPNCGDAISIPSGTALSSTSTALAPAFHPVTRRLPLTSSTLRTAIACGVVAVCSVVMVLCAMAAYRNFSAAVTSISTVGGANAPRPSAPGVYLPSVAEPTIPLPLPTTPVALPPAPPPRPGWQRVTLTGEHSAELPDNQIMRDTAAHKGEHRDLAWWPSSKPYTSATLCFTHITTDRLTESLPTNDMAYFHNTPNDFFAFEFKKRKVQGFESDEYILRDGKGPEYAWHQFIRIRDQEWILVNGYARDGKTQADVDHFVQSLRISPAANLAVTATNVSSALNLGSMLGGLSTAGWKSVASRSGVCSVSMPPDATFKNDGPNNPQVVEEYRWPADCGPVGSWEQSAEYLIFRIHHDGHGSLDNYPQFTYAGHEAHELSQSRGTAYQVQRDIRVNGSIVVTLYARSSGNKLTRAQLDAFLNSLKM
jgi:hypothetical protein